MAFSSTVSNGSSVSLVDTLHSRNSVEHINTIYDVPSTNPYLYKPIRPTKSRLRPALPTVFLQLPDSDRSASPWKQRQEPRRQASFESTVSTATSTAASTSTSNDSFLIKELSDTVEFIRDSSPAGSNVTANTIVPVPVTVKANKAAANVNRFSTCFSTGSASSLLDPEMMQVDKPVPLPYFKQGHHRVTTSDYESSDSGDYRLQDWSTPRIAKAPTLRISSKDLPSLPAQGCSKGPFRFRSASSCSMYRDESSISFTDDDSDILHIRLPAEKKQATTATVVNIQERIVRTPRHQSTHTIKRKNQELKAEKEALKIAERKEDNLRLRLQDPKVQDAATAIDGLFGIGKEESKAMRCGYAGLGIAYDKRTWKATDDYQTLLRDTVRSSLYNLSPRSTMKRKFSSPGVSPGHSPNPSRSISSPSLLISKTTTETPRRRRKDPPPPLHLSSLSSFSTLGEIKTAQRKFVGKVEQRTMHGGNRGKRGEDQVEVILDDGALREMKTPRKITLKGIMRSVRSISNLRSGH